MSRLCVFVLAGGLAFLAWRMFVRPPAGGPDAEGGKVTLVVWDWWSPSTTEAYKAYFDELKSTFEARHPDIRLRFQFVPFSNYPQKLTTAFAGRRPPDVFQCSVSWAEGLYERGVLLELNDLVARTPELAMDKFLPSAVMHNQKDGRIYGIPIILDAACLIYNLDIFEEVGLPTDPLAIDSWDTFLRFCKLLTVRDERGRLIRAGFGMNGYGSGVGLFYPFLYANGGRFNDEVANVATFDSPEGIEAVRFLLRLRDAGVVPPFRPQLDVMEEFIAGRVAMFIGGTWSGKYIERNSGGRVRFAMTNFPPGPHGRRRTTITWGNMLVISRACRNVEAAWEFVRFTAGLEGALLRLKHLGQNSARKDFYRHPAWKEAMKRRPYLGFVEQICLSGAKRPTREAKAVESAFAPYFEWLLLRGKPEDVPRVLHEAARRITEIYKRTSAFFAFRRLWPGGRPDELLLHQTRG